MTASREAAEGLAWLLRFGVEREELDGCVLVVPQALVVVRFLGKLSVLLG